MIMLLFISFLAYFPCASLPTPLLVIPMIFCLWDFTMDFGLYCSHFYPYLDISSC
uniref:Uncharacterized protein n=1 Tax=Rhizophora mucronata TaxID=61149 RepID=A0A2P2N7L8_RHIMU